MPVSTQTKHFTNVIYSPYYIRNKLINQPTINLKNTNYEHEIYEKF